jgi:hypothetical protein
MQLHRGVTCMCDCIAKTVSSLLAAKKSCKTLKYNSAMMEATPSEIWGQTLQTMDTHPSPKTSQHAFYLQLFWRGWLVSADAGVLPLDNKKNCVVVWFTTVTVSSCHCQREQQGATSKLRNIIINMLLLCWHVWWQQGGGIKVIEGQRVNDDTLMDNKSAAIDAARSSPVN